MLHCLQVRPLQAPGCLHTLTCRVLYRALHRMQAVIPRSTRSCPLAEAPLTHPRANRAPLALSALCRPVKRPLHLLVMPFALKTDAADPAKLPGDRPTLRAATSGALCKLV